MLLRKSFYCMRKLFNSYVLTIDEYGITNCTEKNNFISNCGKGSVRQVLIESEYSYNYEYFFSYKWIECKLNYKEERDNLTNIISCLSTKCTVSFCDSCVKNNFFTYEKCAKGFINMNGLCNIKPKKTPTITFKDIFRFSLNKIFNLNGNMVQGLFFRLKGIINDFISEKHSFIVSAIFSS